MSGIIVAWSLGSFFSPHSVLVARLCWHRIMDLIFSKEFFFKHVLSCGTDRWVSFLCLNVLDMYPTFQISFLYRLLTNNTVRGAVGWFIDRSGRCQNISTYRCPYFWSSHSTLQGLCRISTRNTVENYFSRKLFHYNKSICPTSLTIKMMIAPTKAWLWTNRT